MSQSQNGEHIIQTICTYERLSAIFWIILGIFQILTILFFYIFGPIVGIWNIFAAISSLKLIPRIKARDPQIPAIYRGVIGLILIGLINLFLGGFIGVFFVLFDFYIRHIVLSNSHLFTGVPAASGR